MFRARWRRASVHCAALLLGAGAAPSCSFLLDFPEEGAATEGGGGAGGGAACEALAVEACTAEPTPTASGCEAGTRTCEEDGSTFSPCECGALVSGDTFSSATGTARGTSVVVESDGGVVVAGTFTGSINLGGSTLTSTGEADLFLARFSPTGQHVWSKRFGDETDQAAPPVLAGDSTGAVIMCGAATGALSFGGADIMAPGEDAIAFVAKFDPDGEHVSSHGHGEDSAVTDVAVAPDDTIAVVGLYRGALDFGAPGVGPNPDNDYEVFVARLDADGNGVWEAAQDTDAYDDDPPYVRVGPANETIVAGVFAGAFLGSADQTGEPVALSSPSPVAYVMSYDHESDLYYTLWSRQLHGTGTQTLTSLALDESGDLVLAGSFKGTLETGEQPALESKDATSDLFLVRLAGTDGEALLSKAFTESGDTRPSSVTIDASGSIVIAGSMNGEVDFGGGAIQLAEGATEAAFLVKLDTSGAHVWSKSLGALDALLRIFDIAAERSTGQVWMAGDLIGTIDLGRGPLTATDDLVIGRFAP